jgi:hypothetical protein
VLLGEQPVSKAGGVGSNPTVLADCPVTLPVMRPDCRSGETGSTPVQGAERKYGVPSKEYGEWSAERQNYGQLVNEFPLRGMGSVLGTAYSVLLSQLGPGGQAPV